MRTVLMSMAILGLVAAMPVAAMACGGHEARAADCLEKLFGQSYESSRGDHSLTVSVDGQSHTAHGAEQSIIDSLEQFLTDHGVQMTSADPCDSTSNAHNVFQDENLAG